MKKTILILLVFFSKCNSSIVCAQPKAELVWSKWIPIIDRNENKILFSVAYEKPKYNPGVIMYFKIQNKYNEPITGRFNIKYTTKDGRDRFIGFLFHCLQPQNIQVNDRAQMIMNVHQIHELKFIDFNSCSGESKLISYTKKDTVLFRLQDAMLANQLNFQNNNTATSIKNTSNQSGIKQNSDFSDSKILYKGINQEVINTLLSNIKGWRTNSGLQVQDGIPPKVPVNGNCQRDQYVFSAILYSWAAESYYRINETSKAETSAQKVGELIEVTTHLCGSGPSYVDGGCKTAKILPCKESSVSNNNSTGSLNASKVNSITTTNNNDDTKKEKELLYGLLPLAAMAVNSNYNPSDGKYIADITSKLDAYIGDDDKSGLGTKLFMKLATLNIQSQLSELNGMQGSMNSDVITKTNLSNSFETVNSGKSFGQMSDAEIKQTIAPLAEAIVDLFSGKEDEYGETESDKKFINKKLEEYREINRELKLKHGYNMDDLLFAIRNFDDELLDKILITGFPIDLRIRYKKSDAGQEIGYDGYGYGWDNDMEEPIHYAAKYGNVYAIKKLVIKGANIRETRMYKKKPMYDAIENNQYEAVKVLFELGIDPDEKIVYGGKSKPIDIAREWERDEIVDLIRSLTKK